MKRLFNRKRKKNPEPPQQPNFPGVPTNPAAGTSGLQQVEGVDPEGEQRLDYRLESRRLLTQSDHDNRRQELAGRTSGPGARIVDIFSGNL